jgi:hypothetical protein
VANPHNIGYLKTKILKMEHTMSLPGTSLAHLLPHALLPSFSPAPPVRFVSADMGGLGEEEEDAAVSGPHGGSVSDPMTDSDRHSTTSSSSSDAGEHRRQVL